MKNVITGLEKSFTFCHDTLAPWRGCIFIVCQWQPLISGSFYENPLAVHCNTKFSSILRASGILLTEKNTGLLKRKSLQFTTICASKACGLVRIVTLLRPAPKQKLSQIDGSAAAQPNLKGEFLNSLSREGLEAQRYPLSPLTRSKFAVDVKPVLPATFKVKHLSVCHFPPLTTQKEICGLKSQHHMKKKANI